MDLFQYVYLADILERNVLESPDIMDMLINCLASAVGSLTNPRKLARTFAASGILQATNQTISRYLGCLMDAFLINKAERYDIKGKKISARHQNTTSVMWGCETPDLIFGSRKKIIFSKILFIMN